MTRLRRAAVLLGSSLLAIGVSDRPAAGAAAVGAVNGRSRAADSSTATARADDWLLSGRLLDSGRLPVVTVFTALGLALAWLAWSSDADARALLAALAVCLLFAFGRTTFGSLVDVIPGSADVFFRRFMMGVQLAALLLAGRGAAWLAAKCMRLLEARVPRWRTRPVPGCRSRRGGRGARARVASVRRLRPPGHRRDRGPAPRGQHRRRDLDRLIAMIERDGGGRTYAGMPSNWGQDFTVGSVPVFKYLESRDVNEVGYTLRTASLMTGPEYYFDDRNPPTTGCSGSATSSFRPASGRRCPRG